MHAASRPRVSELAPPAPQCCPVPIPVARSVYAPPAPIARHVHTLPASRVFYAPAVPVDCQHNAAPVVRRNHASPVAYHAPPGIRHAPAAPSIRRICLAPAPRHTVPTIYPACPAPVVCHAASIVRSDDVAPPQFTFESPLAPSVSVSAPLPFPLHPDLVPTTSVTAQAFPSTAEVKQLERVSVCHTSRDCHFSSIQALVGDPKQKVEHSSHCCGNEEDVAVQKEEGRGWKSDLQPRNDESERRCATEPQQEVETQQKTVSQRLDEDEPREMADEEWTGRIADEDRTRMADEE